MLKERLKVVVAGSVDDGKSTLIGRLLYETDSLPDGKLEELKAVSLKRNMPMEWSFVLDAFQAERDQAITIDTSQIALNTVCKNVVLIDAPGHIEFLKNMVSGAANADAALLLVDAVEGVRQQTRRHSYLLNFLGIQQVVVIINKMDLVDFSQSRFEKVKSAVSTYLDEVGLKPLEIIPISARHGDLLTTLSRNMKWYQGPTVLEAINNFTVYELAETSLLRFPVQDVYKFDERRIIAGRVESGTLCVGDELLISPSNQVAKVHSFESWNAVERFQAKAGDSVGITLDKQLFVERGDMISHLTNPPLLTTQFRATLFWLGDDPLQVHKTYKIKLATREVLVTVQSVTYEFNIDLLKKSPAKSLMKNQCGEVILRTADLIPVDEYQRLRKTGRFVFIDGYEIVAGGMLSMQGFIDQRKSFIQAPPNLTKVTHFITKKTREQRHGHKGAVLWFTGLSGAGKSTLAMAVERILFLTGCQVYVLDGDNIRSGLNANLTFSPQDRTENIRRISEVAALFVDAGFICITSFISPYAADRNKAREIISADAFHEIYIKADLETCERRDPKGLYKKARKGDVLQFTGISSPYEIPSHPELIVDTVSFTVEQCINKIVEYAKDCLSREKLITSCAQELAHDTKELTV